VKTRQLYISDRLKITWQSGESPLPARMLIFRVREDSLRERRDGFTLYTRLWGKVRQVHFLGRRKAVI
jgi:hypothetical protein